MYRSHFCKRILILLAFSLIASFPEALLKGSPLLLKQRLQVPVAAAHPRLKLGHTYQISAPQPPATSDHLELEPYRGEVQDTQVKPIRKVACPAVLHPPEMLRVLVDSRQNGDIRIAQGVGTTLRGGTVEIDCLYLLLPGCPDY